MNNDLISREALKKYVRVVFDKDLGRLRVVDVSDIDNAPTVDIKDQIAGAYNEGYACGSRENARPQGEWLWLGNNPHPIHKWSCNKCGRGVKEQENFCPNCGADMRGEEHGEQ